MWDNISDFFKDLFKGGIIDALIYIFGVIIFGTITAMSGNAFLKGLTQKGIIRVPIIIIVVSFVLLIFTICYKKLTRKIPTFSAVESDYIIIERKMNFLYNKNSSTCEIYFKLKSTRNGTDRFNGKYTWSGSEPAKLTCDNTTYKIVELARRDSFLEYEVLFMRTYKKGQFIEFTLNFDLPDAQGHFIPFLSSHIREITKKLVVSVNIPPAYGVREVICEVIEGTHNKNDCCRVEKLDSNGKYVWEVRHPQLLHIYSLRWTL